MSGPFVLARLGAPADESFATLPALAGRIVALRDALPARPDLRAIGAMLARDPLPGGRVVALRLLDGEHAGRGTLLGYAFMPGDVHAEQPSALMDAIAAAAELTDNLGRAA